MIHILVTNYYVSCIVAPLSMCLTRFNKTAIQGTPQMAIDKEAISLSKDYSYYCTLTVCVLAPYVVILSSSVIAHVKLSPAIDTLSCLLCQALNRSPTCRETVAPSVCGWTPTSTSKTWLPPCRATRWVPAQPFTPQPVAD